MKTPEFIYGHLHFSWEREHTFQAAGYCYDSFIIWNDGSLSLIYWGGLKTPFITIEMTEDIHISELIHLELKLTPEDASELQNVIRNCKFQPGLHQYWDDRHEAHPKFFLYLNLARGDTRIRAVGLHNAFRPITEYIETFVASGLEPRLHTRSTANIAEIKSMQKDWRLDGDLPSLTQTGQTVIPREIWVKRDPIL